VDIHSAGGFVVGGDAYIATMDRAELLPILNTDYIYYDEYASHMDTTKLVNGKAYMRYARIYVTMVSENNHSGATPKLVKSSIGSDENTIKKDELEGETVTLYSKYFDYTYKCTVFDLTDYLDINTSGRPAIACRPLPPPTSSVPLTEGIGHKKGENRVHNG